MKDDLTEELRAWERRAEADPGDALALERSIAARRRLGLAVPPRMRDRVVRPARAFKTTVAASFGAILAAGRTRVLGHRESGARVHVPPHRVFWLSPPELIAPVIELARRER